MSSVSAQLASARQSLAAVAGDNAALEARVLAAHAWGVTPEVLVREAHTACDAGKLEVLVQRRMAHEPIAQIVGSKHFWKDAFAVSRHVLTPRADSETMIEALLRLRTNKDAPLRVLDLGTGSGCLLLSTLREYPAATGVGVDQSVEALSVAKQNAESLGLMARAMFAQGSWCSAVEGSFDVVLSNPPYIPTADIAGLDADVRLHEPHAALDGGVDGLDCYRDIIQQVMPHLNANALVLFEVGQGQDADVAAIGQAQGLTLVSITRDLAGIARIVAFTNSVMGDQHEHA